MRVIPRWRRKTDEERQGQMTLIEHLRELRHRMIVCLWALLAASLAGQGRFQEALAYELEALQALNDENPAIVMATSGMLEGGPSVEYFKELAPNPKNKIMFVSSR